VRHSIRAPSIQHRQADNAYTISNKTAIITICLSHYQNGPTNHNGLVIITISSAKPSAKCSALNMHDAKYLMTGNCCNGRFALTEGFSHAGVSSEPELTQRVAAHIYMLFLSLSVDSADFSLWFDIQFCLDQNGSLFPFHFACFRKTTQSIL